MEGLRALARVIARHYLAHPELYPAPAVATGGASGGAGKDDATVNAVARAEGDLARKEEAE